MADQYEQEVRKLRGRIDELKRDLANAEDEVKISLTGMRFFSFLQIFRHFVVRKRTREKRVNPWRNV